MSPSPTRHAHDDPSGSGRVVFINGVPSAGKSSVAAAIKSRTSTFRVLTGDDVIRQVPHKHRVSQAAQLFARTLDLVERWAQSSNVVFDGAWTESQVTEARARFGSTGMFVILRISESERNRRESRRTDRRLGYPWDPAWHRMPGPDDLYDVVIDTTSTDISGCADIVLAKVTQHWNDLRL